MLTENNNIDKLFQKGLGEYEKTPPAFVWINIQQGLDRRKNARLILLQRTIGIAAAVVLALLAGWWMTNPLEKSNSLQNSVAEKPVRINTAPSINNLTAQITGDKGDSVTSVKENHVPASKISRFAAFAPNPSFIGTNGRMNQQKSDERVLLDSEKEALDKLEQKFKVVKKITEWIAEKVANDTIASQPTEPKPIIVTAEPRILPDRSSTIAMYKSAKNSGRWSLKAELAPVFNGQVKNGGQASYYLSDLSKNYSPQKTTTENTISAGLMAGYKVAKRLTFKSGVIYNNIRQSTSNVDLIGINSQFTIPGNVLVAATPAGQVTLHNAGSNRVAADFSSIAQTSNTAILTGATVLKQNIDFVEVPILATYKLIDSKLNVGITGGINTGFLVGNKVILSGNGDRIASGETSNLRNMVYSGAVGLELGYEITNRITLTVEPRVKRYLNSLSSSKSVNYKPYQMEIATGLTYCFN
jgi:hypothetical protein